MKLLSTFLVIALAALLVSCSPPPSNTVPPEPGSFPVTFVHQFGSTTLERKPERIINVGVVDQDAFLALDAVPVATKEWFGKAPGALFPWALPKLGSRPLPTVLNKVLDFERIASLKPDVITALYSELTPQEYEALAKIAPTIAYPAEYGAWGIPWQEVTRTAGRILGRAHAAEDLIIGVERDFEAARKAHPEFAGVTAALVSGYGWPDSYYALGSHDGRVRFLKGLGFANPVAFDDLSGDQFGVPVPRARLNLADQSLVVWLTESPEQEAAIRSDGDWVKSAAFREGRDIYLPSSGAYYAALNFSSVLSLPYAIAGLVPVFEAAVDGKSADR